MNHDAAMIAKLPYQLTFPSEKTLPELLQKRARTHGDRLLFSDRKVEWTANEAIRHAGGRASALAACGVSKGDRVALLCTNRAEFMEVVLGCAWLGAIVVPINTASRGAQLQHILNNSGARLLVVESSLIGQLAELDFNTLAVESAWVIAPEGDDINLPVPAQAFPALGQERAPVEVLPGDVLAILYTSGTSGPSKGVICPHAQFYWWGVHTAGKMNITEDDVIYTALPLFHTNAFCTLFQALVTGAPVVVDSRFSASGFFNSLIETGATVTYLLGAMVAILLSRPVTPAEKQHRVRLILGPGVPAQLHDEFLERTGIRLLDGFGSTETNYVLGQTIEEQRNGYMGRVSAGFEARVVNEADEEVADGVVGELLLRAHEPYAFALGYYGMPEKTVEAWRNLWFHTGDRVVRDADGYYRFVDRLKDMIRRRGENISAFEVEEALSSHPAIEAVAVFAVQSDLAEDEVMAKIVLRPGQEVAYEALMQHCEPRLAHFAVPRFIEFTESLPKTENGKIQKFKLRDEGIGPNTWDREKAGYQLKRR